jgi:molybdopterin-containing oxidoreductase family iron-sulfur binding subunit
MTIAPTRDARRRVAALQPDRRGALKLLAGGTALALAACRPPDETIVPYVDMPEGLTPGLPLYFATALPLSGFARGVIVTSHEGRPTKIDGNPRHPASLGACDPFAQAELMSLYDPDRAKAVANTHGLSSWDGFAAALLPRMAEEKEQRGSGLRIVTGRVASPTLLRQLRELSSAFPESRWIRYEPIHDDAADEGARLAFGRALAALPRIGEASVVLALDADPLGPGPAQLAFARAFAEARQETAGPDRFLRLYVAESGLSLTGANADERLALPPQLLRNVAIEIAQRFGAGLAAGEMPDEARRFARAAAAALERNKGRAIVLAGRGQPAEAHALCHWINARIAAPVDFIEPADSVEVGQAQSLRELADDLAHGRVETLLVLDCNLAYCAPGELGLGEAIGAAPFSAYLGLHDDETAARCQWRLPLSHMLESWSDLRAFEGTASIVQPLIRPLYDSRTAHQLVALLGGSLSASPYGLVRETWKTQGSGDFDSSWAQWLHDGVVAGSSARRVVPPPPRLPAIEPADPPRRACVAFSPDPSIWDGRFCNNAWLQECPKPSTKEVWGNALHVSPQDAASHGLEEGDIVELTCGRMSVEAPIHILRGQAIGVLGATLGYGRSRAGAIGNDVGFDAYALQSATSPWTAENVMIARTRENRKMLTTQQSFELDAEEARRFLPEATIRDLAEAKVHIAETRDLPTLLPSWPSGAYEWAMVIDVARCIGCNACVVACQAENNVPVVGPGEIAMGRDMHWLRVDAYFLEDEAQPRGFQPVPCMHCEKAPCEPVCPVEASVHDSEGLNVQVYNRCVGTRFCQSNCPYKVRRFNFFGYANDEAYANLGDTVLDGIFNPDVTVRSRGVMEKCTYCVQRISRARRGAEKEERRIADGEVVTACEAACPTRAIAFGNLALPDSRVNALRKDERHYALLGRLGTRPRTTYLARLTNPDPSLRDEKS